MEIAPVQPARAGRESANLDKTWLQTVKRCLALSRKSARHLFQSQATIPPFVRGPDLASFLKGGWHLSGKGASHLFGF